MIGTPLSSGLVQRFDQHVLANRQLLDHIDAGIVGVSPQLNNSFSVVDLVLDDQLSFFHLLDPGRIRAVKCRL